MRRLAMLLLLVSAMISGAPMPGAQAADPPGRKFVVFFQEWSVAIDDAAVTVITEAAHLALEHPRVAVQVTGFADPEGGQGYFQHRFDVYGREGQPCLGDGCGGVVKRIVQGGRSTFYCQSCQRR